MTLAPIVLFAYKRPKHTLKVLKALQKNKLADQSELFIYCDGPMAEAPEKDLKGIAEVRSVARKEKWCGNVHIIENSFNKGLAASIVSGVTETVNQFGKVIVLEDDVVTSPVFLQFVNEALNALRDRVDIYQISGYFVPHHRPLPSVGLIRIPDSWGWATWQRAWQYYCNDASKLLKEILSRNIEAFNLDNTFDYLDELKANAVGTLNTWLIRWYASIFLRGGLTLYPGKSLTRNIGFTEGGTNCGPDERTARTFFHQRFNSHYVSIDHEDIGTFESPDFVETLEIFYRWQEQQWVKPTLAQRIHGRWQLLTKRLGI